MKIVSTRLIYSETATRGIVAVDGAFFGYTLEDRVRPVGAPKVHGETAIPAGIYEVGIHPSPRFKKRLPWIKNVPGFNYILAHGGNKHTDTEGCILVAREYKAVDWIFGSLSDALAALVEKALARGEPVTWQVIDSTK